MICDYLHQFYTMPALISVGGVPTIVHLRWYQAPPGAKILPIPNTFFSHVWDDHGEAIVGEPGELGAPRVWDPGRNVGYQGQCYVGDPSWFATGQLPAYVLTQAPPPSPCLCQIPPAQAAGSLVLTGSATVFCQPFFGPPGHTPTVSGTGPGFSLPVGNMVWNAALQAWIRGFSALGAAWSVYWFGNMGGQPGCGQASLARAGVFPGEFLQVQGQTQWVVPSSDPNFGGVVFTIMQS